MIGVKIGGNERPAENVADQWATREINRCRAHDGSVCIRVRIDRPEVKAVFSTPGCASGGLSRPPTTQERRVHDFWQKHHLDTTEFTGGDLTVFLCDLHRLL